MITRPSIEALRALPPGVIGGGSLVQDGGPAGGLMDARSVLSGLHELLRMTCALILETMRRPFEAPTADVPAGEMRALESWADWLTISGTIEGHAPGAG